MPRKLVVCLVLVAVVLALVLVVPLPDFVGERQLRNHNGRALFWGALLLALPWPDLHVRRAAMALAIATLLASFADLITSVDYLQSQWGALHVLRGALGLGASLLVLWTLRQTDVLLWSSRRADTRDERP